MCWCVWTACCQVGRPPFPVGGDVAAPRGVHGDRDDRYGTREINRMPESYVTSRQATRPMNFEVFDHKESFEEFAGAGMPGVRPPMFPGRVEDRSGSVPQYVDPLYPGHGEDRARSIPQHMNPMFPSHGQDRPQYAQQHMDPPFPGRSEYRPQSAPQHMNPMFPGLGQERPQSTQQNMDPPFPGRGEYRPQSAPQQMHPLFSNLIRSAGLTDYFQVKPSITS